MSYPEFVPTVRSLDQVQGPPNASRQVLSTGSRRVPVKGGRWQEPSGPASWRLFRWPVWVMTRFVAPLCLLLAIGCGILYVRLLNGAIPLKPLAGPIERAISAELPGISVSVDDASVLLADSGAIELRLNGVTFKSEAGVAVGHARDAAVSLNTNALWSGRLAPSRITLIEPRLRLGYSQESGLSLSLGQQDEQLLGRLPPMSDRDKPSAATPPQNTQLGSRTQIDLSTLLATMIGRDGRPSGTTRYIKSVGLRNATLVVEHGREEAVWRISEGELGFDHGKVGSAATADFRLIGTRGPWRLLLSAAREEAGNAVTVEAKLTDAMPSSIAGPVTLLAPLYGVDVPVTGSASLRFAHSGELLSAAGILDLGRGTIAPGWRGNGRLPVDAGRLTVSYEPSTRRIVLHPSRVQSGTSWAVLEGVLAPPATPGQPWHAELKSREGMLGAAEFSIAPKPLEMFRARASFDPDKQRFEIADVALRSGGGEISFNGHVEIGGSAPRARIQGNLSPMPVETLKLLWPSVVAPNARRWSGNQIQQGRLTSGTFLIEEVGAVGAPGAAGGLGANRISVALEGTGVRLQPKPGFSPVEAGRVLVRLEGNALEVVAPDAAIVTGPQRRLPLRGVRLTASDVSSPTATGDLTLRAMGPLPPALDLAEQQAARNGRPMTIPGEGIDGRIDAQVRIAVPLGDALTAEDTRLDMKGRITDGRVKGLLGGYDINGATISIEMTDQSLDAKGDMLVGGVPAKLTLKRIFAASDGDQPPILISGNLDTADRSQLGLDINDFVQGEMPVEVLISPRAQGEPQVQLRGSLTNAEMVIEALGWKKPPGRPATLQFEVVRPSKQRTELQNLRIVGEDISLTGTMVLDSRNKAREFSFPELSLHVVSRLQLTGTLKPDNNWDVTVRGKTLDGRDFFQSLFAIGQLRSKLPPPRKDQAGVDLKAEIDTVLGHNEVSLKGLKLQMSNRGGRTVALTARGIVEGSGRDTGRPLDITIQQQGREPRRLVARTDDAGQAFRMIGFYPSMLGGRMQLDVNLDGSGNAEKTGRLYVERFSILGDPVGADAPSALDAVQPARQRRVERPRLDFDSMRAPFELGHGQVIVREADLRGQVLGVVLTGKADFRAQYVDLGGTYVPLQGLNSAIGQFPILGQILAGPRGEGVIGMTFAIQGPMSRPQVVVNPASILPGILREMTKLSNPDPRITPRDTPSPASGSKAAPKAPSIKSSSTPGTTIPRTDEPRGRTGRIEADGGWTSQPPSK